MACVFLIPDQGEDLLFKFGWEETLQLICELRAHIDIKLVAAEILVFFCNFNQFEFQLNIARKQHEWGLSVTDVRSGYLLES